MLFLNKNIFNNKFSEGLLHTINRQLDRKRSFNSIHYHKVRILFSLYYNVKQYACTIGNVTDVGNSVLLPTANWPKNLSFMQ